MITNFDSSVALKMVLMKSASIAKRAEEIRIGAS